MISQRLKWSLRRSSIAMSALVLAGTLAVEAQPGRSPLVITSTNDPSNNSVVVFKLNTEGTPSLPLSGTFHTGGKGGASTNAGIVQFNSNLGAVANYGSNTVSQLVRYGNSVALGRTIDLASDCVKPDSVALTDSQQSLCRSGTNAGLPNERALLGGEGTRQHLVHGEFSRRRHCDLLQRRAERRVL